MDAKIKVEFTMDRVCEERDLEWNEITFEEMVRSIIESDGLFGVVSDNYRILSVEEI